MVKVSANRFVQKRVNNVKSELEACNRRLRSKAFKNLEEIFAAARRMAQGETKHQRIGGKMAKVTLNQRRIWLKIAQQAAEAMNNLAGNIDEKELKIRLDIIEKLLNEATRRPPKQVRE